MKMGRGISIGNISENGPREKSLPTKFLSPKNVNNNNIYKKCIKGASQSDQGHERLIPANAEIKLSFKSKTLDFQNGNVCELHKSSHADIHISRETSHQVIVEQRSGTLKVKSFQIKPVANSGCQKEVFQFWSTKVNVHDSPGENTLIAKPKPTGNHKQITKQSTDSTTVDHGQGHDLSKSSLVIKACKMKKREEILATTDFTHVDDHVLTLSSQIQTENVTVGELARKITEKSTNNIEKIRAIWIWLCHNISYDVEGYLGLSQKLYRAEDLLDKRKGVCAGYAGLCSEMCREIGIRCREISGFSRGAEHSDSVTFHRTKSNHMWNAVELAGQWYLLDACWGAGTVDLQKGIFIPSYDDFFFLTDPEDFIETHWPDDPSWQLLQHTVSFEDFEQKIFKTSEFFRLRLFIISPKVFYLTTEDGEVKVSLGSLYPMEFSYKIYKLFNNSRSFIEKTFGILTNHESSMTLRVMPPTDGQYELMIFARPTDTTHPYKWVCSYQIDCPQPKSSLGLPENPFHFWGLHQKAKDFGVINYNSDEDLIFSETGSLNLIFKTSRPLLATFQLIHPEMSDTFSKKCLVSQIEDNQLGCHLLLPFHGYYRLSLFVKGLEGENFQNTANVFIKCKNPLNHNELFPKNLSNHCGPGTNTRRNGLTNPSHTSPIIRTTTGKCNITFHTLWDLEVFTVLENSKVDNRLCSLDRYCLLTHLEHKIGLTVHLPELGHYKLSVLTKSRKAQEFSHACDYVIRCYSSKGLLPFPNVYNAWGHGCTLLQPQVGLLPIETWENFRVKIPGACKVLVIGPIETELQLTKNKIWEGKVFTGIAGSLIKIAVKFTPNSTTMDIVMSFKTQRHRLDKSSG